MLTVIQGEGTAPRKIATSMARAVAAKIASGGVQSEFFRHQIELWMKKVALTMEGKEPSRLQMWLNISYVGFAAHAKRFKTRMRADEIPPYPAPLMLEHQEIQPLDKLARMMTIESIIANKAAEFCRAANHPAAAWLFEIYTDDMDRYGEKLKSLSQGVILGPDGTLEMLVVHEEIRAMATITSLSTKQGECVMGGPAPKVEEIVKPAEETKTTEVVPLKQPETAPETPPEPTPPTAA
jgi:hypothetical protein